MDYIAMESVLNRLKENWLYEVVINNFVYFPEMKYLWESIVKFSMVNEVSVWELINFNK